MSTPRRLVAAALAVCFSFLSVLPGCDGSGLDDHNVGVQIQNSTGVTVTATLDGPSFSPIASTIPAGQGKAVEFPAVTGDVITLDVKGAGMADGGDGCRLAAEVVDSDFQIYAQFTIVPPAAAGGAPTILCSSGWQ